MPERWRGVSKKLRKEPNLDMVALALRDLDPASAPGHDGITRAFYNAFSSHFFPVVSGSPRRDGLLVL